MRWRSAVQSYIHENLNGDVSLATLSNIACLSPFHFHRQFQASYGVTLGAFIRLCRIKRAAALLAFRDCSHSEIAGRVGYQSTEGLSRAFKRCVGQSPQSYRRLTDWYAWDGYLQRLTTVQTKMDGTMRDEQKPDVSLMVLPAIPVAVLTHRGNPALLGKSLQTFIGWRKARGLHPSVSRTFNRIYGDPRSTPAEDFKLDLCVEYSGDEPAPLAAMTLAAGDYACIQHQGSDAAMATKIDYLYRHWLPAHGREPADEPLLLERKRLFPDVPEQDALTDIYLPLRAN